MSPGAPSLPIVAYLARGADPDPLPRFERFVRGYRQHRAGEDHVFVVIFKGYANDHDLGEAKAIFAGLPYRAIHTDDDAFDLGAYRDAARQIDAERFCFFNSNSEILSENWLAKLSLNFALPHVGLVGATGSLESLSLLNPRFPRFPNLHLRSNAFMVQRRVFLDAIDQVPLATKLDAFSFESGVDSLTQRILGRGLSTLIIGRNGRGYLPRRWTDSETFRLREQGNLLVHDNVTRAYEAMPFPEKQQYARRSWGEKLDGRPYAA